jgi:SAM-dependent methyltransferase
MPCNSRDRYRLCVRPTAFLMDKPRIQPENSAQGTTAKGNPFVEVCFQYAIDQKLIRGARDCTVVDQGCGKLRHLATIVKYSKRVYLVDTRFQLEREQVLAGRKITIGRYLREHHSRGCCITLVPADQFQHMRVRSDLILCACVFDVVLPETRRALIQSASVNLRPSGVYFVIIPRNDQKITSRCNTSNRYEDGHVLERGETATFYRNFRHYESIETLLRRQGFKIVADLSRYRDVCLICRI